MLRRSLNSARAVLLILACAAAPAASAQDRYSVFDTDNSALLVAPEHVRQGDLLIAWAVCAAPVAGASAALIGTDGVPAASAPGLPATSLFADNAARSMIHPAAPVSRTRPKPRPVVYVFFIAVPTRLPAGHYKFSACGGDSVIVVGRRNFLTETIKLDETNTAIRTRPDARKDEEAKKLYDLLCRVDPAAFHADISNFVLPVSAAARRSSFFGDRRIYEYSDGSSETSEHAGIDFAVAAGTPVRACARGKVVMAAERIITGGTLVIEHFPGVYSMYMHLSDIEVAPGAIVEQGGRIGHSGSTGLSTGPHLHWELRVRGSMVDPESLTTNPLLDKALIITTIRALIEGR
jgi:murein DD-endopeptidase MepM/ murein hydrolase activator NlpD